MGKSEKTLSQPAQLCDCKLIGDLMLNKYYFKITYRHKHIHSYSHTKRRIFYNFLHTKTNAIMDNMKI